MHLQFAKLVSAAMLLHGIAGAEIVVAQRVDMPTEDVKACGRLADVWSRGQEWRHFIPASQKRNVVDLEISSLPRTGELLGHLSRTKSDTLAAIEVVEGGSCTRSSVVLARPTTDPDSKGTRSTFRAVVTDLEDLAEDPGHLIEFSNWGGMDKLVTLNRRLYKVRGVFPDPRTWNASRFRQLRILFAERGGHWQPICSFEEVNIRYVTSSSVGICGRVSNAKYDDFWSPQTSGRRTISVPQFDATDSVSIEVRENNSTAGCGRTYWRLFDANEFGNRTREQVLLFGAPNTLVLNGIKPENNLDVATLKQLFGEHADLTRSIGGVDYLTALEIGGETILIRNRTHDWSNTDPFDLDVINSRDSKVNVACKARAMPRVAVKYFYRRDSRPTNR